MVRSPDRGECQKGGDNNLGRRLVFTIEVMRLALFIVLLLSLSWPALARQDQTQTPPAQNSPAAAQSQSGSGQPEPPSAQSQTPAGEKQSPAQGPPPPSQAPAQPSTPAGAQEGPATAAPPASAKHKRKTREKKTVKTKTSKSRRPRKESEEKKEAEATADAGPRKIVIRRGGTSDTGGQLEPGVPESEASRQRKATEQVLQSTEARVKSVSGRKLTPEQQDMVRQIEFYIQQARAANQEGDLGRARNLAIKAHQLGDALARQ